jgi:hypothetical protein
MTGKSKATGLPSLLRSISLSSFHIEMKKSSRGAVAVISGVMSIGEYTSTAIELLSHSGRIFVFGESLGISVLEGRIIEIYGKITEMRFSYGKA